jgi:hypothetical protein
VLVQTESGSIILRCSSPAEHAACLVALRFLSAVPGEVAPSMGSETARSTDEEGEIVLDWGSQISGSGPDDTDYTHPRGALTYLLSIPRRSLASASLSHAHVHAARVSSGRRAPLDEFSDQSSDVDADDAGRPAHNSAGASAGGAGSAQGSLGAAREAALDEIRSELEREYLGELSRMQVGALCVRIVSFVRRSRPLLACRRQVRCAASGLRGGAGLRRVPAPAVPAPSAGVMGTVGGAVPGHPRGEEGPAGEASAAAAAQQGRAPGRPPPPGAAPKEIGRPAGRTGRSNSLRISQPTPGCG